MKIIAAISILITLIVGNTYAAPHASTVIAAGEELSLVTQTTGKNLLLRLLNKEGKTVQSIAVPATDRKTLGNYLPSIISKKLNSQKGVANAGTFVAKVMGQKLLRFPVESAGFFAALGAVMTYELVFNYAQNPVAYEQLYKSQLDPVGQLGFYFFMVGNGVSAEPLLHMIQQGRLNPRLAPFIPFFGMSVGFVASNIVHELGDAPNLRACALGLLTGKGLQTKPCDQAANVWYNRGGVAGIANQYAPSMLSLIGSTIASGLVQSGASSFGKFIVAQAVKKGLIEVSIKVVGDVTVKQITRIGAIEVAALFIPGSLYIKGFRVVGFVTQLAVFSWIDEVMRRPVDFAYQNITRGRKLQDMHDDISSKRLAMAKDGFSNPSSATINELKQYGQAMTEWRQVNMANVLESQSNWEQALAKLANYYNTTEVFYRDFVSYQRDKLFGRWASYYASGKEVHVTDRIFPLYGVTPSSLNAPMNEISLVSPETIEEGQMLTIRNVIESIRNGSFFKGKNLPAMDLNEKRKFNEIINKLSNPSPLQVGSALASLGQEINANINSRAMVECPSCDMGTALQKNLKAVRKSLGNPTPIITPGFGFALYYQQSAAMAEQIQKTQYMTTFGKMTDSYRVQTPTLVESMLTSMLIGPDVDQGQPVVGITKGYPANFYPPKITKDASLNFILPVSIMESRGAGASALNVFGTEIGHRSSGEIVEKNAFLYLSKGGIRSSVLNKDDNQSFEKWWDNKVEPQYVKAWMGFETQYQQNVAQLILRLWNSDQSIWNRGGTPNGVMSSVDFQNGQYLGILKDLALSVAPQKNGNFQVVKSLPAKSNAQVPFWKRPVLAAKSAWTFTTDWLRITVPAPVTQDNSPLKNAKVNKDLSVAMVWHSNLINTINNLKTVLKKIKAVKHLKGTGSDEIYTISTMKQQDVEIALQQFSDAKDQAARFFNQLKLNPAQNALAKACLNGLSDTAKEISNYAMIANSVSYRFRQDKKGWISPRCQNMISNQKVLGVGFVKKVAECE